MRKVIYKWFWVWGFEKEEKWLNNMSERGLKLCKVGLCKYTFEECKAGEYQYKLEMIDNSVTTKKSKDYIAFLKDMDIEYIGNVSRWIYLRKKTLDGQFELFSNIDSKIAHLNRIFSLILVILGMEIAVGIRYVLNFLTAILAQNAEVNVVLSGMLFIFFYIIIGIGIYKIVTKIKKLKNDRILHE